LGKFKKRWFSPFKVQHCSPNNIVLVFVNNSKPNPLLVNNNKLKPYKYVDQMLKGIQSLENQKYLESINSDHRKIKSNEDLKDHKTIDFIDIDQIVTSKEASLNLMSQQVMILLRDHNYIISQSLDYKSDRFVTS
jgi:hypothetical protein